MIIVNLRCGNEEYGDIRIDIYKSNTTNLISDLKENIPLRDNSVDIVYSKNMLEHLGNPLNFIEEISRILKPKGKVYLITDNAGYWRFHLANSNFVKSGVHAGGYKGKKLDKHYTLFTIEHLKNLFTDTDFQITYIGYEEAPVFSEFSSIRLLIDKLFYSFSLFRNIAYTRILIKAKKKCMKIERGILFLAIRELETEFHNRFYFLRYEWVDIHPIFNKLYLFG